MARYLMQGLFPDSAGARIGSPAGHNSGVWPSALSHTRVPRTGACAVTASPASHCRIARGEMPTSRNAAARAEALELLRYTSNFADRCAPLECSWRRFVRLARVWAVAAARLSHVHCVDAHTSCMGSGGVALGAACAGMPLGCRQPWGRVTEQLGLHQQCVVHRSLCCGAQTSCLCLPTFHASVPHLLAHV